MGQRPSELYGVKPKYVAYFFDRAVETFGKTLEERLRVVAEGTKNQKFAETKVRNELMKWLGSADEKPAVGRFRDPALMVVKSSA